MKKVRVKLRDQGTTFNDPDYGITVAGVQEEVVEKTPKVTAALNGGVLVLSGDQPKEGEVEQEDTPDETKDEVIAKLKVSDVVSEKYVEKKEWAAVLELTLADKSQDTLNAALLDFKKTLV